MKRRGTRVNCMLCGYVSPIAHVIVYQQMRIAGRVCSKHTLMEVIQSDTPEFDLRVRLVDHKPMATLAGMDQARSSGLETLREYMDTHDVSDIWDLLDPS